MNPRPRLRQAAASSRASGVSRATSFALFAGMGLLASTGCASRDNNETPDARVTDVFTSVDRGSGVAATVAGGTATLRDTLYNPRATCDVTAGTALTVHAFRDGFYKVGKPARCTSLRGDAAWVFAGAVTIPAASYSPRGLGEVVPDTTLAVAMNYAGNKIFCTAGKCLVSSPLYAQNRCLLRDGTAKTLRAAAAALQKRKGARWKIRALDCYRPAYVQERMWDLVPDPAWVARLDRARGNYSKHNRGLAVDVTLEDGGTPVDMGSGFDEFTARSNYGASGLTTAQKEARALLRDVMAGAGFRPYDGEWWHFSVDGNDAALDLPL